MKSKLFKNIIKTALVMALIAMPAIALAQYWYPQANKLTPSTPVWGLKIPAVNPTSGATRCVNISSTGVFGVAGADCSALYTFSSGLTNTANVITNNLITGLTGGQKAIGGTGVTDKLQYQGTTGNGTSTAIAHEWLVGNNGATSAGVILNNTQWILGASSTTQTGKLELVGGIGLITRNTANTGVTDNYILNDINSVNRSLVYGYTGSSYGGPRWTSGINGEQGYLGTVGNFSLGFLTNGTQRVTIREDGRVGIGLTTPQNTLNVFKTSASGVRLSGYTSQSWLRTDSNGDIVAGTTPVTSLNSLTGALTLAAGSGISLTPVGSTITIAATGGGSSANTWYNQLTSFDRMPDLTNDTTETSIIPADIAGSVTISHDTLVVGSTFLIKASGNLTDSSNPRYKFRIYIGGLLVGETGSERLTTSETGQHWDFEAQINLQTIGTKSVAWVQGKWWHNEDTFIGVSQDFFTFNNTGDTFATAGGWFNSTVNNDIEITVELDNADSNNHFYTTNMSIQRLDPM